jgi:hypothetical protein
VNTGSLTEAANEWERLNHEPDALYRGARLSQTSRWTTTNGDDVLNTREQAFLRASLSAQARAQAIAHRRTRRLRQLLALLTVLLVVASTATAFALRARQSTIAQRNHAIAQKVLSQAAALRATNPALAMQLTLAAHRLAPGALWPPEPPTARVCPVGHVLAAVGMDVAGHGTIHLWDVADPEHPRELATRRAIAGGSSDGTVGLWDVSDPRHPSDLNILTTPAPVWWMEFSPENHTLVTGGAIPTSSRRPSPHRPVQLWETDMERIAARVCRVVWPRMNQAEWRLCFPEISYRASYP